MLANRISESIRDGFKIPAAPTIAATLAGNAQIAFTYFKNLEPKPGLSTPSERQEAFVFNIPLIPARFPVVSIDGRRQSVVQEPGKAYLFDLTSRNEVSLETTYESVRVHLPQSSIDGVAYERGLRRIGGLSAAALGQDDIILHRLALTVLPAIVNSAQVTTAFVEYIALALHDHVIYTYGGVAPNSQMVASQMGRRSAGGLAPWQIRRACEFIEAHLASDPSITVLSRECGLSASHFVRAFRASLGLTPHQWLIKRRLERAKQLMALTADSLAEISLLCGFVDQSHLGRYFVRMEGVTPAEWRRRQLRR